MSELFFVLKSLIVTIVIVVLMQVKWSGATVEQQATAWLQKSSTASYLQGVAQGGVLAGQNFVHYLKGLVGSTQSNSNTPGHRLEKFELKRSTEALEKEASL